MVLTILKLLVVVGFLIMFIRRPNIVWGVGLLTVTSAVLLDTLLGTFNRDELLADLGFFFYVIAGVLLAGGAAWFWGLIRPRLPAAELAGAPAAVAPPTPAPARLEPVAPAPLPPPHTDGYAAAGVDRQMLYEQVRQRFSSEDVRDLMFDLEINELDVMTVGQSMDDLIVRVMDAADTNGNASTVALAVERILTPPPAEHLPRLEKLSADSPRTVLRHFLLANYSLAELERMAGELGVDWEQLDEGDKKVKVRSLLLYLYRRGQVDDLLRVMAAGADTPA